MDAGAKEFKKVYVSLYQTHIPVLVDAGVVEYDRDRKLVRLTSRAAPLFAYLDLDLERAAGTARSRGLFSRFFRHEPPAD